MPPRKRTSPSRSRSAADGNPADGESPPPHGETPPDGQSPPPDGQSPRLGRNPDADPVRIHREYVQQRLGGGALPTPEAYERALDQWRRLPGAVSGPAAEPHPDAEGQFPADTADEGSSEFDKKSADTEEYDGPLPATDPGDNRAYERRQR